MKAPLFSYTKPIFFLFILLFSVKGWGQIAQFNFPATNSLVVSAKDDNVTVSNFALSAGTIGTNITTGSYFPNEPYIEESGGWTATTQAAAKNFNFTITAAAGYQFTITNVSFRAYATSAGPSAFGFAVGSTDIYSVDAPNGSLVEVNQAVTGQENLTSANIKIQGWLNGSRISAGTGAFRLDDVVITGTVTPACVPPTNPNGSFSGNQTGCGSTNIIYTHGAGQPESGIDYYWQTSTTGTTVGSGNLVSSGSNYNVSASGNYYVRAYNSATNCWSAATSAYAVTIATAAPSISTHPASTSVITPNSATFSVTETGGTSYQWQVDTGSGFGNISGANASTYNTGTTTMGMNGYQYRVIVTNACGSTNSNAATLTVTAGLANDNCSGVVPGLTVNAAATAGTFVGATPSSGFPQSDVWYSFTPSCTVQHTITVSDFSGTDLDFAIYANTCPASSSTTTHATGGSSNNPEVVTTTFNSGTTYYIRIYKWNNAGSDTTFNIRLTTPALGSPTTITASPTTFCAGATVTFTATAVTNATSYVWTVPTGWTMTPSSTNTMTAVVGSAGGNVTAQAVNCYGTGIARSISFSPNVIPTTPLAISGSTSVCAGTSEIYSIAAVSGATSYTWTLPSGWTGTSSTNSITVTPGTTGGNISVTANNTCGPSSPQTLNVTVNTVPATPSTPTSNSPQCLPTGVTVSYAGTAPAGETWYWQTTATGTDTGNSAATYTVTTAGTSTVYLRSRNNVSGCWSVASSTSVTVNAQTTITTQPANQTATVGATATFSVVAAGAGLAYQWQVDTGSGFNNVVDGSGANTASYTTPNTTLAMNGYKYRVIITGSCGNVTSNGNATLSVVTINYINGDFMTQEVQPAGATWTNNSSGTVKWYKRVGGNWVDAGTEIPNGAAGSYTVYITQSIEVPGAGVAQLSTSKIHILNNATLTYGNTSNQWTFRNIIVDSGASLHLKSRFTMLALGEFEVKDGGNFIFDYGSNGNSFSTGTGYYLQGIEKFHPNSNFILKNTDGGDFLTPAGLSAITPNSAGAYFGNIIVDYTNGENNLIIITSGTYTAAQFQTALCNDLIFKASNGNAPRIYQPGGTYIGSTNPLTIQRNLIIEDTFSQSISFTTASQSSGNFYLKVNNDFINNGPVAYYNLNSQANSTALYYLMIGRNMVLGNNSSYIFRTNQASTASMYLQIAGNLTVAATGEILDQGTNSSTLGNIWFNGTSPQTIEFNNPNSNGKVAYSIRNGASVKLINQDLALGSLSTFTVRTGGTFDFGFNGSTALNVTNHVNSASFTTEANSTIKITSPEGITTSTGTGNVRTMTTGRTFNPGGIYHYIGKTTQATGNGLPSTGVTGKVIVDLETSNSGQDNIDFTVTGTNYFATASGVNGTLDIRRGRVIDAPGAGFRNYNGTTDENQDGESDTHKGDVIMTGGRYVVSGGGTKPSLSGNYTLTGGTVEFAGTAASTKIRVKPIYHNLVSSGNTIASGGKNLTVNNLTTVTAGTLTIPESTDLVAPYVLTAKKGIQVAATATALFQNNAQLMQDETGVSNTGSITTERKVTDMDNNFGVQTDYVYWSAPVSGQNIRDFSPATPWNFRLEYNETTDFFVPTLNSDFTAGKGYALRAETLSSCTGCTPSTNPANNAYDKTYQFKGTPNNADQSIAIKRTNTGTTGSGIGYNLVGNPYPSNISFDALYDLNDALIYKTAWFWTNGTNTTNQQGSGYAGNNYAVYNATGGNSANYTNTNGTNAPNGIIKVGQGFIIQKKSQGAGTLQFKNKNGAADVRVTTAGSFYQKSGETKNRYWLKLVSPSDMANTQLIGYVDGASDGFEQDYDAEIFELNSDIFYSFLGDKKLLIQGKAKNFSDTDVIPVGANFSQTGQYTIALNEAEGIFAESQPIYIHDKSLNIYKNLQEGAYHFNTNAGQSQNRFEIVYLDKTTLGTDSLAQNDFLIFRDGQDAVLKSKNVLGNIEIYDASGRLVKSAKFNSKEARINMSDLAQGFYIFKIENSGNVKTRKWLH